MVNDNEDKKLEFLKTLQQEYNKTIPEKLRSLKQLMNQFANSMTIDNLTLLKNTVHKITGSAGTYGYMHVSDVCKAFELDLSQKIMGFAKASPNEEWLIDFESYYQKIKDGFSYGS